MRHETFSGGLRKVGLGLALVLGLGGCEQVIDVPEPAHTPALAVRYTLGTTPADSAWNFYQGYRQLYVSASKRLFDQTPLNGRNDATARLYDAAGNVVEEFQPAPPYNAFGGNDFQGYYAPTRGFTGIPGQTYRLRVEAPGYEAVESSLTLPPAPPVVTGATFVAKPNTNGMPGRRGTLTVNLQDDAATRDYYVATVRLLDMQGRPLSYAYVQSDDSEDDGSSDTDFQGGTFELSFPGGQGDLYPFADTDVSGKAFALKADLVVYAPDSVGNDRPVLLETIVSRCTRETYDFWLSRRRYYDTNNNPFAEPAPLRSNIKNGFGIFGGMTDGMVRVALP